MDMRTLFIVLILTLSSRFAVGQSLFGSTLIHDTNVAEISSYLIHSFAKDLEKQILEGSVRAYEDAQLKVPLSKESAHGRFFTRENQQIINPANPDDPYDLIDTVIYYRIKPTEWHGIGLIDPVVKIDITDRQFFYVPQKFAQKLRSYAILVNLSENAFIENLEFNSLAGVLSSRMDSLQWLLYSLMFKKERPIYLSIDGTTRCNYPNEHIFPCDQRMNFQVINPQNPEDKYDLIDTVVTTPASAKCMSGILFGNVMVKDKGINLHSLSIDCEVAYVYRLEQRWEGGRTFEYYRGLPDAWYWVLWKDLQKDLKPADTELLEFLNIWCYLNPSP
jgi:hypothetical protein